MSGPILVLLGSAQVVDVQRGLQDRDQGGGLVADSDRVVVPADGLADVVGQFPVARGHPADHGMVGVETAILGGDIGPDVALGRDEGVLVLLDVLDQDGDAAVHEQRRQLDVFGEQVAGRALFPGDGRGIAGNLVGAFPEPGKEFGFAVDGAFQRQPLDQLGHGFQADQRDGLGDGFGWATQAVHRPGQRPVKAGGEAGIGPYHLSDLFHVRVGVVHQLVEPFQQRRRRWDTQRHLERRVAERLMWVRRTHYGCMH